MPTHALFWAIVAVDKGGVWDPRLRRLIFQLLAIRISSFDPVCNLFVHGFLNLRFDLGELRSEMTHVLVVVSTQEWCA